MTPLAQRMMNELCVPVSKRQFIDNGKVLPRMDDIHCFELTAVIPLLDSIVETIEPEEKFSFYPAPRTWIEFKVDGGRFAFHIDRNPLSHNGLVTVTPVVLDGDIFWSHPNFQLDPFERTLGEIDGEEFDPDAPGESFDRQCRAMDQILACLAIINSPGVIGRTTRLPHAGLQRKVAAAKGITGSYPLRAWTEIHLKAFETIDDGGKQQTIVLSGRKCLHFVRAFARVVAGKLQIVSSHWRGDPALGIKRSRYVVTH